MKDKIFEIINKILNYETSKQVYINYVRDTLSSKIIKINIEDISFDIFLSFDDDKITILQGSDKVDVEISGTLTSFIFYTTSRGSDLFSSKINISGDVESANSLNKFLKESGVIKAIIIEILGQKTSSSLFSILEPIKQKYDESNDRTNDSISNFLKYDIELIPTKSEINDYIDKVDDIKSRTEKLINKIK